MNVVVEPRMDGSDVDVIVVGGGIYGLMIALEAGRAGRRVCVLERDAVGGATSSRWFRILHGGLRYLQALDIPRFNESVAERRWFQRFAPDLVRPMRFLMPLYGEGMRRPAMFRAAFLADAVLAHRRNTGISAPQRLPRGQVLDAVATRALCPGLRANGLQGGALWYDVIADDSQRLIGWVRTEAESFGACVLEGVDVMDLVLENGRTAGVAARREGAIEIYRAPVVINAAGPWSGQVADRFGAPVPALFHPSLAFNLRLNIAPPAEVGLAISPPGATKPTLFVYPDAGGTLAGTWHVPWRQHHTGSAQPSEADIEAFLTALNRAMPALGVQRAHVSEVLAGFMPAQSRGVAEPANRAIIHDHGAGGGPTGLFSVSGVKYTTARDVAEKLVRRLPLPS